MTLAEDVLAFFETAKDQHPGLDYFDMHRSQEVEALSTVQKLAQRLPHKVFERPTLIIKLALQALATFERRLQPRLLRAELTVTLPRSLPPLGVLATPSVMGSLLQQAQREVLLLGYRLTSRDVLSHLHAAGRRGAKLILIVDRGPRELDALIHRWPADVPVRIYTAADHTLQAEHASIHGKALVVDGSELLVSSANFTDFGLYENLELGLRVSGRPAQEARRILEHVLVTRIVELVHQVR